MYAPYSFLNRRWIMTIMPFWKKPRAYHGTDPVFEQKTNAMAKEFNKFFQSFSRSPGTCEAPHPAIFARWPVDKRVRIRGIEQINEFS
jgi:hypothetical protein